MKYLVAAIIAILSVYYAYPLIIGPDRVIEEVTAFAEDKSISVQVNFAVPVRYESHFPLRTGEVLQVKMRLVSLGKTNWKESVGQGSVRPELAKEIGLISVAFEGDVDGGPYLTFLFNRPMDFEVKQDSAMHSVVVVFPKRAPTPGASS